MNPFHFCRIFAIKESKLHKHKQIFTSPFILFFFAILGSTRGGRAQGKGIAWALVPEGPDENSHGWNPWNPAPTDAAVLGGGAA